MNPAEITLGALLHDIGKFMQRAYKYNQGLDAQSVRMKESLCPVYQGRHSHQHVLYTNAFFGQISFWPNDLDKSAVENLAAYHHRPDTPEQKIVAEADCLSSGMERAAQYDEEANARTFRRTRLLSTPTTVMEEGAESSKPLPLPMAPLTPDKAFPLPADQQKQDELTPDYRLLWDGFLKAWNLNQCAEPLGFINRACSVLERFTWCIPSATYNVVPDISLFDHMKTTAALAVCLADPDADKGRPFLLVAGDLTGIQNYIFNLHQGAGGLARSLRARSFQVAAYAESVSLNILSRLELSTVQRLLFAGGKFHLLLPNSDAVRRELKSIRREANDWLLRHTSLELGCSLACMACKREDFADYPDTARRLSERLRDERERLACRLFADGNGWRRDDEAGLLRPPLDISGDGGLCGACRRNPGMPEQVRERSVMLCSTCKNDRKLGGYLPKARFAVFFAGTADSQMEAPLGRFSLEGDVSRIRGRPALVQDLNGTGELGPKLPLVGAWRARHIPTDADGAPVEFGDLAQKAQGRPALAFLKMDVDNLGWVFFRGLKGETRDRTSISRTAALSRALDLFLSAHLEMLLQHEFPDVYLIYSGGDDTLAVGPWNQMFALAARIREDFRKFTGGNPAWTLSAGLVLANPHTPVTAAVESADRLLEASKILPGDDVLPFPLTEETTGEPRKNRVTAFGTSIPWVKFSAVMKTAERLAGWLKSSVVNTGKVRRLLQYADMYREFQRTRDTRHLQYLPLLTRDIRRNWTVPPEKESVEEQTARKWVASLAVPDSEDMKALRFVCEYAINCCRSLKKEEE